MTTRPTRCRHTHLLRRTASADLPIGSAIITAVRSDACRAACGHPSGRVASAHFDLDASEVRTSCLVRTHDPRTEPRTRLCSREGRTA